MGCVSLGEGVVLCGSPTDSELRRRIRWCPFEQRNQEMVERFEEWYGCTLFCCGCGDSWSSDEGQTPRPLYRYWRRDAVLRYRRLWDRATYGEHVMPSWWFVEQDGAGS